MTSIMFKEIKRYEEKISEIEIKETMSGKKSTKNLF